MVGNENDARLAVEGLLDSVGAGCTRVAYVADDVVYKVGIHDNYSNRAEFECGEQLRSVFAEIGVVIPEMQLFEIDGTCVIAMPYVFGEPTGECIPAYLGKPCDCVPKCLPPEISDRLGTFNYDVISWGNTIRDGDTYYAIDLGSS